MTHKNLSITIDGVSQVPLDCNNIVIRYGNIVHVPEPTPNDVWNNEFAGTVVDYLSNGDILVEDGDSDFFQMSPSIVELVEHD